MSVNGDSQVRVRCPRWFTVAGALLLWALPAAARADRVVLLPVEGQPEELVEEVEQQLVVALRRLGHEPLGEQAPLGLDGAEAPPPPQSAEDFAAIAAMQQADWALHVRVEPGSSQGYWLRLRAGYAPATRLEELRAEVRRSREAERYRELLGALLRPEGLGEDAARLGGEDAAARRAEAAGEARPDDEDASEEDVEAGEEAVAGEPDAEEAAGPSEQAAAREDGLHLPVEPSEPPEPHEGLYVTGALALAPIVRHDPRAYGGTMVLLGARAGLGKAYPDGPDVHWRAGLDVALGDSNGFTLVGGALYEPLRLGPVALGAMGELGLHKATTGNDVWQLMARVGASGRMALGESLFVEATLPELTWYSANGGGVTVGGRVALGLSLD